MRLLLFFALMLTSSGCGIGLNLGDAVVGGTPALSFNLQGLSLRKNDCTAIAIGPFNQATATVTASLSVSSHAKAYSSALGCQTYSTASEITTLPLESLSATTFYVRADAATPVTLRATFLSGPASFDPVEVTIPAEFTPFSPNAGTTAAINEIVTLPDGKTYLAGQFQYWGPTLVNNVARLRSDGTLDTAFGTVGSGLFSGGEILAAVAQADGRLIVGGDVFDYNGTNMPAGIARLKLDGTLDTSFIPNLTYNFERVNSFVLRSDGFLYAASDRYIYLLNQNGLDAGLGYANDTCCDDGFSNYILTIELRPNGKIFAGGAFSQYDQFGAGLPAFYFGQITPSSHDPTFSQGIGVGHNNWVYASDLQADGKVIAGGSFNIPQKYVMRLNVNGSLDTTFSQTGTGLNANVTTVVLQDDGKVLVGGAFTAYNGTTRRGIIRLNADGTLDTTFSPEGGGISGGTAEVRAIAITSDKKILVGGSFTAMGSTSVSSFARLTFTGSLD